MPYKIVIILAHNFKGIFFILYLSLKKIHNL
jgi:hypothetical protein